jgi:hypothetical protein
VISEAGEIAGSDAVIRAIGTRFGYRRNNVFAYESAFR